MILEITILEYLLKHVPLFLLFSNGCGVGDSLDKIKELSTFLLTFFVGDVKVPR